MLIILKKLAIRLLNIPIFILNYKIKMKLIFKKYPYVEIHGKGCFRQEVVFWGLGRILIGENYSFGYRYGGGYHGTLCEIQPRTKESVITIGKNIATNNGVFICSAGRINIGDNCLIGQDVIVIDHDAHGIDPRERRTSIGNIKSITIGNNVWIGSRAVILPGTKIGNNCIIGAGAIVKGCFLDNTIIAGNPAKVIKTIKID